MAGHRGISASATDLGTSRSRGTAVIADMVNYAIAGIGFIHAAGRLFVRERFSAGMNTGMTQNGTRRRDQRREPDISALTEAR